VRGDGARELPKRELRELRELAARAHEEELRRALVPLAEAFRGWEQGRVSSFELSDLIHEFHQGPARELYVRYALRGADDLNVASAVARGVLGREEVPAEVLEHLRREVELCERMRGEEDEGGGASAPAGDE
jgi:hypothetical protein